MDGHRIWRIVRNNYDSLENASPEGYVPVVDVYLVGRPEPVRLGEVQTSRDETFPWALLVAETAAEGDAASSDERLVFVPEQYVERIEVSFVPSEGRPLGFSYRPLDDE